MTRAATSVTSEEPDPGGVDGSPPGDPTIGRPAPDGPTPDGPTPDGPTGEPRSVVPETIRRRLMPFEPRGDTLSWFATGIVVLIAAIVRFRGLAHPPGKIFDEIYYARDAWGLLTKAVEWNYKDNVPSYVVHPPLGKWLIALGEWSFGYYDVDGDQRMTGHIFNAAPEFGWRFSAAVAGVVSVLLTVRIARRMFGSTILGCAAGLLLALDGFHLVLSRTALLDIFLLLFVLATFGALVADRDARRRRWLYAMEAGLDPTRPGRAGRPNFTWRDGVPWWRLGAAVLFGCAVSVKWSALFFLPAFVLLILWWEIGIRRSVGARRPWRDALLGEIGWLATFGVVLSAVYLATWSGWLLTDHGHYRHWLADSGQAEPPFVGALRNLFQYHYEAFKFHSTLEDGHPSQSWPWQWLLLGRPIAFHWTNSGACGPDTCTSEVLLLGTPLLWWSFLPALAATLWLGIARRDWRANSILLVTFAGLAPWVYYAIDAHRTMFSFYVAPVLPFMVFAVVYVLGAIVSPARAPMTPDTGPGSGWVRSADRRLVGAVIAGAYVLLVAFCFIYFHKVFVGEVMSYTDWSKRMWLGTRWHP